MTDGSGKLTVGRFLWIGTRRSTAIDICAMAPLRHLLLVITLVLAQLAAGVHAVEHAVGKEGVLPDHACELCLSVHDLGAGLSGVVFLPPIMDLVLVPEALSFFARSHLPPPCASQRAPPAILL